ncbi:MAG: thioredoxin family protein [Candidatus Hydrothermarchaeota archaeon]
MVKIEVFTSPTCVYCPYALDIVTKVASKFKNVSVEEVDISDPIGRIRAISYGIDVTPTIVVDGIVRFVGVPDPTELARVCEQELKKRKK